MDYIPRETELIETVNLVLKFNRSFQAD